jgi:hypothetical protein
VSTALNYFRKNEHVVNYYLPKNFNDRFNSSDSRDKNVRTLDRPKTTEFDQTFVSQPQNIEVVWREKSKQLLFEIPRFHISKVFKDL